MDHEKKAKLKELITYKSPKQRERDEAGLPPIKLAWQEKIMQEKMVSKAQECGSPKSAITEDGYASSNESSSSSRPLSRKGSLSRL